ncbi:hypothetical protein GCM10011608_11150 [Micromonospora sonchi]|uniref:Uncharacterized protein n=1 Tax=Micromonospora sonchi TaxID=1763543 RepID=A0A917TLV2_9ACTN|nr:hypothetical protein [Micromonospora sonchi]GGM28046.1 hypothetical protein GCM10011608_11150 [Micromonospora sonchi]
MRLLLYAAAGAAGICLALTASQDPARADTPDGLVTGTVNNLLDPLAGKRKKDRPTPVRDTLTQTTSTVGKTVNKTIGTAKTVTGAVNEAAEPLPVAGRAAGKVTDTAGRTLDAVTKPRTSEQPQPPPDLDDSPAPADPDPAAPATPTPGEPGPPPAAPKPKPTPDTARSGPQTAPEPERRSPTRRTGSGAHHLPWQAPAAAPTNRTPTPAAAPATAADTTSSAVRDQQQPHQPDSPDMGADSLTPTGSPTPPDGTTADTPTHPNLRQPQPVDTSTQRRGRHHPPTAPSG